MQLTSRLPSYSMETIYPACTRLHAPARKIPLPCRRQIISSGPMRHQRQPGRNSIRQLPLLATPLQTISWPWQPDHMNTKVSAYIAFLSAMRAEIPATERLTLGVSGVTDNTPTVYLDANGNVVSKKELSSQQKKLLNDYRLIQYDMTAGKNYLSSTKFFDVK